MQRLSATECITPAIDRTKLLLFSPFRKGRTWKLCATSYACRYGSMYVPIPLLYLAIIPTLRRSGSGFIALLVAVVAVALALFTWVFHLCSKLQFAYFDIVANRGEFVAPAWRKYRAQALPWTFLKLAAGTIFTLIFAAPLITWARHVLPLMGHMAPAQPGGHLDPQFAHAMAVFYAGYGLILLFFGLGMLFFGLLGDFILPSLALENTTLGEAFRRMGVLIRQEPGEFALYVLLKTVLGLVAYFAAFLAWEIAFVLLTLIVGGLLLLVGWALHLAGIPMLLLTVCGVLLAIAWYVFLMYTAAFPFGLVMTWMDAYAIYFLAGRYPMLGDMVDASTPPPTASGLNPFLPAYPPPAAPPA